MPRDAGVDEVDERRRPREHGLEHDEHEHDQQRRRRPRPIDPIDEPRGLRHDAGARRLDARQRRAHPRVAPARLGRERRLGAEQLGRAPPRPRRPPAARARAVPRRVDQQPLGLDAVQLGARRRASARRARRPRGAAPANAPPSRGGGSVRTRASASFSAAKPAARGRDDGIHGHAAERLLQRREVELAPFALGRVDHRQRDDHRPAEIDELLEQIEPLVEPSRVDDGQDRVRARRAGDAAEQHVDGDLLVGGRRAQRVRAGQIDRDRATTPPNVPRPTRRSTVTPG